ncbi:hypothetical protein [Actinocrinis sp.]|uniref:hypothetical protein n=1 Tax=Actinocrinis sp. TaxID=1920516 RepID=UPI002D5D0A0B|nr:hypothetical protein [Actinocrinis sp.]HZP55034.1 hypothetical protein [Actinocrinis sp.]
MKIDLPSGAWADLLAPDKLKAKHQRAVMRAVTAQDQREGGMAVDLTDGVIAIIIQDWNVTGDNGELLPLPSEKFASLDELTIEDYETLLGHEYVVQVATRLMKLRGERVSPDDWDDPESPSVPSAASGPGSRAERSPSTRTSARSGTKTKSTPGSRSAGAGRRKS